MNKDPLINPILKWVGGKRQLLDEIMPFLINKDITTYVEPFFGGGAVLFELQPEKAIINDFNSELMNVYKIIKNHPLELIEQLKIHEMNNKEIGSSYFYDIRNLDRSENYNNISNVEKAARIIYLNKTCYNGLYRVNKNGYFNTPYGKYKNPDIVNEDRIKAISNYFNENDIKIMTGDYKEVLKDLKEGTFIYFDPPYMPISTSSSFTSYTQDGFTFEQQVELRDECIKLHNQGINFLLSNSYCDEILNLYSDTSIFNIKRVKAKRAINSKGNKRGKIDEVLIYND